MTFYHKMYLLKLIRRICNRCPIMLEALINQLRAGHLPTTQTVGLLSTARNRVCPPSLYFLFPPPLGPAADVFFISVGLFKCIHINDNDTFYLLECPLKYIYIYIYIYIYTRIFMNKYICQHRHWTPN